jgi:hypothetical protein
MRKGRFGEIRAKDVYFLAPPRPAVPPISEFDSRNDKNRYHGEDSAE